MRPEIKSFSQKLRKEATPEERHLWYDFLKQYSVPFRRQVPLGPYILDFYCAKAKLGIELDGAQHYEEEALNYDQNRSCFLFENYQITLLRFTNLEVKQNFEGVCLTIHQEVKRRAPSSAPSGGTFSPGGRLRKNKKGQVLDLPLKTQRRNAVSQKVLLPTFLSRKVGGRNFSQKLPCFSPLLSNLIRKCKFSFRRLDTAPLGEYHRNDTNLRQNTGRRGIFTPGARGGLPCGEDF